MKKIFLLIVAVAMCLLLFTGCSGEKISEDGKIKYNNRADMYSLITERYTYDDMKVLADAVKKGDISFETFMEQYNPQCIRKTQQGYYTVLLEEEGKKVFIFANEDLELYDALIVDRFMTKNELLQQVKKGKTTERELRSKIDPAGIPQPISSFRVTAHIVKEGVVYIGCSNFSELVATVVYYSNREWANDPRLNYYTPFILAKDKRGK